SHRDDVGVGKSSLGRGPGGQFRDRARMASPWRRPQVGEVGDCFECGVELRFGEAVLQGRFAFDEGAPVRLVIGVAEYVVCDVAEGVHDIGVKVFASSSSGDGDGGLGAVGAVVNLDGVGQVEQSHRERNVVTAYI